MTKKIVLILVFSINFISKADMAIGILDKYINQVFVCTGIGNCEKLEQAMAINAKFNHFSEIYGIEKDQILLEHSKFVIPKFIAYNKPKNLKNCKIFYGDPKNDLAEIINFIDKPITFLLSSNFPDWVNPEKSNYILEELDQIRKHSIKKHIILIDYTYFGNISLNSMKEKLLEINPNYKFRLERGGHLGKEENVILAAYL